MADEETPQPAQQAVQVVQMAQSVTIQPMPEFRPDAKVRASLATRWNNWQADFEMFIIASGITDAKRKRALLLYQAGPRVREIFKQLEDTGNDDNYEVAKAKLKEYFDPQKNRRYEVYRFRQAMQKPDETLDEYHTRLRTMAATCEFNDVEFEIEQQIIIGGISSKIRKHALRDPKFDWKGMLLEGRRDEQSSYQIKPLRTLSQKSQPMYIQTNSTGNQRKPKRKHVAIAGVNIRTVCKSKPKAPKQNTRKQHKGRGKALNPLNHDETDNSDEDYLYIVNKDHANTAKVKVKVGGASFMMTLDTGATINVIDEQTFSKMDGVKLKQTNTKAFPYNTTQPVKFLGNFEAVVETRKRLSVAMFYVVKGQNSGNLLSLATAQDLGLITLHLNHVTTKDDNLDKILGKHTKVFHGLGKLKGETVKLDIDKDQIPKAQPQRRIPYHIRKQVEDALKALEKEDVIERVSENEATPWVSPIVVVPKKDGGVRICGDMR
ncbi:Retrovirus-related Pol poly from transposon, partial [Paramuricea clavata]